MSETRHLRLVAFNPSDYSLGEVLVKDSQEEIQDSNLIGAALSLMFQWPDYVIVSLLHESFPPISIELDYDREEKAPSELWVRFKDISSAFLGEVGKTVKIRFEIFRQCYEFSASILAGQNEDPTEASWNLIIEAPVSLLVYKQRRLPRICISNEEMAGLPACCPISKDGTVGPPASLSEMGMRALRLRDLPDAFENLVAFRFGVTDVPAKFERRDRGEAVVALRPESSIHIGAIFEYYRCLAYPNLRPRGNFPHSQVLELYKQTKYIDKFQTTAELEKRLESIRLVWDGLSSECHRSTADYVSVDENGELSGASSATYCFHRNKKPIWAFHQLCAKAKPDLLDHTGQLYTWRAEYLAARTEDLDVIGWFDSRSRWLERIYVKFAYHKYGTDCLYPVSVFRKMFSVESASLSNPVVCKKLSFGNGTRVVSDEQNYLAGLLPHFLNASGILDAFVSLDNDVPASVIENASAALVQASGESSSLIEITLRNDGETLPQMDDAEQVTDVDRMFLFQKAGLVDFLASVEHSVAVTRKKKLNGEYSEMG